MAELRAPDPTLDALADRYVVVTDYTTSPPTAHERVGGDPLRWSVPRCNERNRGVTDDQCQYARWFAVPCRECFPSAPPPGRRFVTDANGMDVSVTYEAGELAWQVTS